MSPRRVFSEITWGSLGSLLWSQKRNYDSWQSCHSFQAANSLKLLWLWDKGGLLRTGYVMQIWSNQNIQTWATSHEVEAFQGKGVSCPNVCTSCPRNLSMVNILWMVLRKEAERGKRTASVFTWAMFLVPRQSLLPYNIFPEWTLCSCFKRSLTKHFFPAHLRRMNLRISLC